MKVDSNYAIMLDALSNSFVAVHDKGSDIYLPLRNLFQKILSRKEDLRRLAGRSSFELLDEFFLIINEVVASSDLVS